MSKNILILGGGGREHAIAWALSQSLQQPNLFIANGNVGTAQLGQNIAISPTNAAALIQFVRENQIDLTIVGPEQPLVEGVVDAFEAENLPIVGPTQAAAQLEGSKGFAKAFMQRHHIPTAAYQKFTATQFEAAKQYVHAQSMPIVLKADGLAAGKGVLICQDIAEAEAGLHSILLDKTFGEAGAEVVIEEFMQGEEASVFALTDGVDYVVLSPAQDHKRIGEGDTGLNTGGMGAYCPAPIVTESVMAKVKSEVIEPTLRGMAAEGNAYRGILYVGLMIEDGMPRVVEYNCRFGDPETQVILPMLKSDLVEVFERIAHRQMKGFEVELQAGAAACVVMASGGYPNEFEKGFAISGLNQETQALIFHAGTAQKGESVVTSGGRVLAVCGRGFSLQQALDQAYEAVSDIQFQNAYFRRDIGHKAMDNG